MRQKILPLVFEPSPILHQKSKTIYNINQEIINIAESLISTMRYHDGLGLAAVQIGILQRVIAINIGHCNLKNRYGAMVLINPEVVEKSEDKKFYSEGCLSFGNIYPEIERYNRVKVKYLDINGSEKFLELSNSIMSSCLQHEIDHTNGIVFLDRLSKLKKDFMMKKYMRWKKSIS